MSRSRADGEETNAPVHSEGPLPAAELQQLWFSCAKHSWSSLVVVPVQPGRSARVIARALSDIGMLHKGTSSVAIVGAEGFDLRQASNVIVQMTTLAGAGSQVIVSVDPVLTNQAGIPIALAADAALLVVDLGDTSTADARRTLELIGEQKFIGAVTIAPPMR